ncbi:MAG: 30S ribosomal protein S19 [Nanobdellota archaeon]
MAKKEFRFKGKTEEELKAMSLQEFMDLLPAKSRRSLKRGFTEEQKKLLETLRKKDSARTHCRDLLVIPEMIGKAVHIHNGKAFKQVNITADMLGMRLGDLCLTRGRITHNSPGVGATKSSASVSVR